MGKKGTRKKITEYKTPFHEQINKLYEDFESQETFANYLEVSRQTVGFWLNGDRKPKILELIKISKKTGKSTDWLLGLVDDKQYSRSDAVKLASIVTGLSHQSIETLNNLKKLDAQQELGALNYLLERISFYRKVLIPVAQTVLCARFSNPYEDPWDDLSEEEINLIDKLRGRGFYHLDPYLSIKYLASQSGEELSSLLQGEIEKTYKKRHEYLAKMDEEDDKNYLEGLTARKELREEEALSGEDSES